MRVVMVLVRSDFVLVFVFFDVASKALGDRRADVVKGFVERHTRRGATIGFIVILIVDRHLTRFAVDGSATSLVTSRERGGAGAKFGLVSGLMS